MFYILQAVHAEDVGVPVKSNHKMRKTFASRAASTKDGQSVDLDAIREILGHSSLKTTLGYIFSADTEK